jgi:nicotinamidase-related amidase
MIKNYGLLITSAQNDLLSRKGKAWGLTQETALKNNVPGKLEAIIKGARSAHIPVIFSPVSFNYSELENFEPLSSIQSVIIDNRLLEAGSTGSEFIAEATPVEQDVLLPPRQGFSSFWTNTIQAHLQKYNVRNPVYCRDAC